MKIDETDKILYQNFLSGDLLAFDKLMSKYRKSVFCFINSYVKNYDVAEDLAQDVFVYILIKRENYDFKYSMKTYLFTIARSRSLNYLKRTKNIQFEDYYKNESLTSNSYVEEIFMNNEQKFELYDAIFKLNYNQRTVLYLSDLEGLSHAEISKTIGKSISETKMILYRARKNLRKLLEKEDIK